MADESEQGRIKLESGAWKWRVTELGTGTDPYKVGNRPPGEGDPDPRPESGPVLVLEDPSDPDHWMSLELDRALGDDDLGERDVGSLARDPDRRQVTDSDGTVWKVERIGAPEGTREEADIEHPPVKVRVTAGGGPHRTISMPEGRYLGQMTRDELVELVGSAANAS